MPEKPKPPTICPKCKSKIAEFKGVNRQTGKAYHFFGCTNPDCRWIWKEPSQAELRHQEIMKGLRYIYAEIKRLEKLIQGGEAEIQEDEIPVVENEEKPWEKLEKREVKK